ncbi:MAG: VOC family protein [Mesorhizobium amorphae]|nr:MAG: VOC family protein [Mesorhizobium amorphae]
MTTPLPPHTAVWFEIPVTDFERAKTFYATLLGHPLADEEGGPNPMAAFPMGDKGSVSGHLYPGKPAAKGTGITIHLAVSNLEDAVARVAPAGGEVVSPVITIPAGRFAYGLDPDGNSFGLFQS